MIGISAIWRSFPIVTTTGGGPYDTRPVRAPAELWTIQIANLIRRFDINSSSFVLLFVNSHVSFRESIPVT